MTNPTIDLFTPKQTINNNEYIHLGIDTEFLPATSGKIKWPWELKLPQNRLLGDKRTSAGMGSSFDLHGDGYATELNIIPVTCLESFLYCMAEAMSWIRRVKHINSITSPPLYTIPAAVIKKAPEEAKILGCMPSMNVYGDNGKPSSLASNIRTTGCHLHISHTLLKNTSIAAALVKWADILVGCTWTYITPNSSKKEALRREAYGRAGEFRLKAYEPDVEGVEYRVLPGTVIQHPAYLTLLFSLYRWALYMANLLGEPNEKITRKARKAINTSNKQLSEEVIFSQNLTSNSQKLIKYMRYTTLSPNIKEWNNLASKAAGHQRLYYSEISKITD